MTNLSKLDKQEANHLIDKTSLRSCTTFLGRLHCAMGFSHICVPPKLHVATLLALLWLCAGVLYALKLQMGVSTMATTKALEAAIQMIGSLNPAVFGKQHKRMKIATP